MQSISYLFRVFLLLLALTAGAVALYLHGPIAQYATYHNFVDTRAFHDIPNAWNVLSNAGFILVGLWGLTTIYKRLNDDAFLYSRHERAVWNWVFLGGILTGIASGYYHLYPNNDGLLWDRVGIAITGGAIASAMVMERVHYRLGRHLLLPLILLGAGSAYYWFYTQSLGESDLRPYIFMQALPLVLILLTLPLFTPIYTQGWKMLAAVGWYLLSKAAEFLDRPVFQLTDQWISGHSLKHILAAIALLVLLSYLRNRKKLYQARPWD